MAEVNLKAEVRSVKGKEEVKRLRKRGFIPAVLYGRHREAQTIQIGERDFSTLAHGEHGASLSSILINLVLDNKAGGDKTYTLIKEIQHNAFTGAVTHIDFNEVSLKEKIHARIPITVFGEAKGEKQGGILDQTLRELEVSCFPQDLPEEIRLDVSNLGLHDSIHISDISLGDKVEVLTDKELSVVSVIVPRIVEEVAETGETAEAAEPELIGRKEKEEETEEGEKENK